MQSYYDPITMSDEWSELLENNQDLEPETHQDEDEESVNDADTSSDSGSGEDSETDEPQALRPKRNRRKPARYRVNYLADCPDDQLIPCQAISNLEWCFGQHTSEALV